MEAQEKATLSEEHVEQTASIKRHAWMPGFVYSILTIVGVLVGTGIYIGRLESKFDIFAYRQDGYDTKLIEVGRNLSANEVADSLREIAHGLTHRKYTGLFVMIGRKSGYSDKFFELLQ